MNPIALFLISAAVWWLVSSFFEWCLHRYVMHRPLGSFTYPFKAHALIHHQIFKADHTYHLLNEPDWKTIPMAWWNGPALTVLASIPVIPVAVLLQSWEVYFGAAAGTFLYYSIYEYIHWCMHLPKTRLVERTWAYRRLNGHHLLHHRYMHKNFNVVFPLPDFLLGTLMVRSKLSFAQPKGPSVPNVQPLDASAFVEASA
jgi:hypothetical protein